MEEDPQFELLRAEAVLTDDGTQLVYQLGCLNPSLTSGDIFDIIIVAAVGEKFLVAVPGGAWDKKTKDRKLESGSLVRPLKLSVPGCTAEDRLVASADITVNVWIGWLASNLVSAITFEEGTAANIVFCDRDTSGPCFPFAEALELAAKEKFQVGLETAADQAPDRLQALEEKFNALSGNLQKLLAFHEEKADKADDSGFATAVEGVGPTPNGPSTAKPAAKKSKSQPVKRPPGLTQMGAYPHLDPGTVAAALKSGVPPAHLQVMNDAIGGKPKRLPKALAGDILVDSEEEEEDQIMVPADPASGSSGDPIASALVKLTSIVSKLSKKSDPLEEALDGLGGSGGATDHASDLARKHAALINALRKTLPDNPRKIWEVIENNMSNEFSLSSGQPNVPAQNFTARGWAEHRSKILGYPRTVRAAWCLAGVLDSIRNGAIDQARAKACLGLAAIEQECLDHGSAILAQEFTLKPPAPVSSFQVHTLPDPVEMPHSRLMDSRWVDAFAHKVKEVDSFVELRKKLGQTAKPAAAPPGNPPGSAKGSKGKGKGSTKGKSNEPQHPAGAEQHE